MCILLVASKELPVAYQSKANSSNPDGCGVAKSFKEGLFIVKNYKGVVETHMLGSLEGTCKMTMTHYRIKTHGGSSTEEMLSNCHPFLLTDSEGGQLLMAGAHNGIFSEFGTCRTKSDTAVFFESLSKLIPVTEGTLVERTKAAQVFIEHILKPDSTENDLFKGKKINIAEYVKSTGSKVGVVGIDGWHMIVNETAGTKEADDKGFIWRSNGTCLPGGGYDIGGRSSTSYSGYGGYTGTGAGTTSYKPTTTTSTTTSTVEAGQSIYRATVEPDGTITVLGTGGEKKVTDTKTEADNTKEVVKLSGESGDVSVVKKTGEVIDAKSITEETADLKFEDPNEKLPGEEDQAHAPIEGRDPLVVKKAVKRVVGTTN